MLLLDASRPDSRLGAGAQFRLGRFGAIGLAGLIVIGFVAGVVPGLAITARAAAVADGALTVDLGQQDVAGLY